MGLYCTVLYYTILTVVMYCTELYCTALFCTVLYKKRRMKEGKMRKFDDKQGTDNQTIRQSDISTTESTLILSGYSRELANCWSEDLHKICILKKNISVSFEIFFKPTDI